MSETTDREAEPLSNEKLAEWQAICEKATPGPYDFVVEQDATFRVVEVDGYGNTLRLVAIIPAEHNWPNAERNAVMFAAARTGWPATIKECFRRESELLETRARLVEAEAKLWIPNIPDTDPPLYLPDYASDLLKRHYELKEQSREFEDRVADREREIESLHTTLRRRAHCASCQRGDVPVNGLHFPRTGEVTETMCADPELAELLAPLSQQVSQREKG